MLECGRLTKIFAAFANNWPAFGNIWSTLATFFRQAPKKRLSICFRKVKVWVVQKCETFVDLDRCCKMSLSAQKSASIQPRTAENEPSNVCYEGLIPYNYDSRIPHLHPRLCTLNYDQSTVQHSNMWNLTYFLRVSDQYLKSDPLCFAHVALLVLSIWFRYVISMALRNSVNALSGDRSYSSWIMREWFNYLAFERWWLSD